MDAKKDYVLDMIIKNLEDVNSSLDKLSRYTNEEIGHIKMDVIRLTEELKQIKERPCPRSPEVVRDIIEIERLKHDSKKPKARRDTLLWIVAITASIISIILGINAIYTLFNT